MSLTQRSHLEHRLRPSRAKRDAKQVSRKPDQLQSPGMLCENELGLIVVEVRASPSPGAPRSEAT